MPDEPGYLLHGPLRRGAFGRPDLPARMERLPPSVRERALPQAYQSGVSRLFQWRQRRREPGWRLWLLRLRQAGKPALPVRRVLPGGVCLPVWEGLVETSTMAILWPALAPAIRCVAAAGEEPGRCRPLPAGPGYPEDKAAAGDPGEGALATPVAARLFRRRGSGRHRAEASQPEGASRF